MRNYLTEEEKNYIKEKILEPMRGDISRATMFDSIERSKIMLESSLKRLNFKKEYEARVIFDKVNDRKYVLRIQAHPKDCEEFISLDSELLLR